MKKLSDTQKREIVGILDAARTGDFLAVRTTTVAGFAIRCLLSRGLKRCWTNHNAPCYERYNGVRIMQFEPPFAREIAMVEYLFHLYRSGGKAILLRPHTFEPGIPPELGQALAMEWRGMGGTPYDKRAIRMFARMIFRKRAHIEENDKTRLHCTDGTLIPLIRNTLRKWKPDILVNEDYPAPIHVEHLIRQDKALFVAGNRKLFERIRAA